MKKLMMATILSIGLLFSQSDQRFASEQIFDIAGQMKVWSKALMTGEMQGVKLTESQLVDTQNNLDQAKAKIILFAGGEGSVISPQVFVLLESLLRTDEGVVFYYKYKAKNEQRVKDAIQLLRE